MEPLPLDILLHIIDLLAGGDDEDIKSLRILSLACKSMVPLCRKHLFSYIRNLASLPVTVLKRFNDLLSKKPDIARYVKRLDYRCFTHTPTFDEELNILDILKKHSSLQRIRLSSSGSNWNNLPESLRSSLVSLIQLPTVVHLDIEDFNEFPATALSGCSNLTNLWLGSIEFSPPEVNQIISRSKIPTLVSLYIRGPGEFSSYDFAAFLNSTTLHAGGPIVDFSRLQRAEFDVDSRDDICHVIKLIEATTQLEYFRIDSLIGEDQPVDLAGLGASLAINTYRTLKILELGLTVVGDDYDPLCGFDRELRFIAGNNVLEELGLDLATQDNGLRTDSEDWSAFDSVLTESDAFPMLRRVLVAISYELYPSESLNLKVESLKEDKFPRLTESKVVEFKFCDLC